ncbi:serine protease [Pseudomaricurvus alkylphenolicus]|uniref:patatin-like phospholipase family protein n=1 Tax=Pseudomaricurvus alkylphenolicus TaxID=1306991 RepID=UPI001423326E|nr:patatin-like phospholipase family protein [Pseudomaricurvus alkylphenolicus]NIB40659.1 serine protease [Pseudomaricurvus alkylphenolicus]
MSTIQPTATAVSLVLGSGGARGLAHIGVIRWLEEHGYRISSISGCSIGALIGGIYTAGKLDEFEHWIRAIQALDVLTLLDVSLVKGGFIKGDKIIDTLKTLVGDFTIEDLDIPFTAVATDIDNEREVWINRGSLFEAIRASISLPLFFTPVERNGVKLIDGGILNPVPIAPTFNDDTDLTIAVNLGASRDCYVELEKPEAAADNNSFFENGINNFIKSLMSSAPKQKAQWGMYDVADQSFDTMQSAIARQKLAAYPPDKVIQIARNQCGILEFDRAEEMIQLGYQRTAETLASMDHSGN